MTDALKRLSFGLDRDTPTAWGARAILHYQKSVELLWDRQSNRGERFKELAKALNDGPLRQALTAGRELHPHESTGTVELYRDDQIVVYADPRASHGYLYMGACFVDELEAVETKAAS